MPDVVFITGSRGWHNKRVIHEVLDELPHSPDTWVIQGAAKEGADFYARARAHINQQQVIDMPFVRAAGRRGGHLRNYQMALLLDMLRKNGVRITLHAFWDGASNGTNGMIDVLKKFGFEPQVHYASERG